MIQRSGTGLSRGFLWDVYSKEKEEQVIMKCSKKLSQFPKSTINSSKRKKSEQETVNPRLFVQLLQRSLRCSKMDVDVDSVIQDELESIEDKENSVAKESEAETASV